MNLPVSPKNIAFMLALIVIIGGLSYEYYQSRPAAESLVEHLEIELDPAIRQTFAQRIEVTKAALSAQEKSGERVEMALYINLASDYVMIGELHEGADVYKHYLTDINQIDYTAWNNYADVAEQMGDYLVAEQAYLKAIELLPDYEEYHRDYVEFLKNHFSGTRGQNIREALEDSVTRAGQSAWSMVNLAEWYLADGDCDEALAHYKVALQLSPDNTALQDEIAEAKDTCQKK
jgi:tetratricopeptide (TPR) repeat protein